MKAGDKIGDYEVIGGVGRGGKGIVYKVKDKLGDVFALKEALPGNDELLRRCGNLQITLIHPGIAKVFSVEEIEEKPYPLMEFIDDQLENYLLTKGVPGIEITLRWMLQMAEAVAYVHSKNVVHGDLKPSNVLLAKDGPKITDFGKNPHLEDIVRHSLSTKSTAVLTPAYAPPEFEEQVSKGEKIIPTKASDIYSLGLVFYRLLTGKVPSLNAPPPTEFNPALPKKINEICKKTAAYNPKDRVNANTLVSMIKELTAPSAAVPDEDARLLEQKIPLFAEEDLTATIKELERGIIKLRYDSEDYENLIKLIEKYCRNTEIEKAVEVLRRLDIKHMPDKGPERYQYKFLMIARKMCEFDYLCLGDKKTEIYSIITENLRKRLENLPKDKAALGIFKDNGRTLKDEWRLLKAALVTSYCQAAYYGWYADEKEAFKISERLCRGLIDNYLNEPFEEIGVIAKNNLGLICLRKKKYRKAKEYFEDGLKNWLDGNKKEVFNNLGVAEALLKNYKKAEINFSNAIGMSLLDIKPRACNLAMVLHMAGNHSTAIKMAEEISPRLAQKLKNKDYPEFRVEFIRPYC